MQSREEVLKLYIKMLIAVLTKLTQDRTDSMFDVAANVIKDYQKDESLK